MVTQADLFARKPKDDTPWAKFTEKGKVWQGVVIEPPFAGQAWDPASKKPAVYSDGNPVMQLTVKIKQNDNSVIRIGFKKQMLTSLRDALEGADSSEVKVGDQIAVAWTGSEPTTGLDRKVYTVKYAKGA